ncbi:alpha/beta hydrolase [Ramlibacter agri]|nr:alpha/beta hydrolase [Ramlibacter agri]
MSESGNETIAGAAGQLFVRAWRPATAPRAVVAICHGFNAHSGLYAWSGTQFAQAGLAAYALDLRGRGRSEGERFYVESFEDYVDDLHRLILHARASEPGLPVMLLGHSAGGVISCLYALDHPGDLAGLVCEDFAFQVPAPDAALAILKGISHFVPHAHALKLKNEDFSRDPAVVKALNEDPLIAGESQPFATMAALVRADQRLATSFAQLTLPLFILHGAADKAARPDGSRRFHEQAGSSDKTLRIYEERFHDPLNDLGKEEVMADIVGWIGQRL